MNDKPVKPSPETKPTKAKRTQVERRNETRAKLVRAAIDVLGEKGGANFTTASVAAKAGLTRGAIQYHFEKPKDLLCAAVVQIADDLSMALYSEGLLELPAPDRVDRVVDVFWQGFRSASYAAILELAIQGRHDPDLNQAVRRALEGLEDGRSKIWTAAFSDIDVSQDDLLTWRASLLVALRGLAVTRILRGDAAAEAQVDAFKALLKRSLLIA